MSRILMTVFLFSIAATPVSAQSYSRANQYSNSNSYSYSYSWGDQDKLRAIESQFASPFRNRTSMAIEKPKLTSSENFFPRSSFAPSRQSFAFGNLSDSVLPNYGSSISRSQINGIHNNATFTARSKFQFSVFNTPPAQVLTQVIRNVRSDLLIDENSYQMISDGGAITLGITYNGHEFHKIVPVILAECRLAVFYDSSLGNVACRKDRVKELRQAIAAGKYNGFSLKERLVEDRLSEQLVLAGPIPLYMFLQMVQSQSGLTVKCNYQSLGVSGWEMIDVPQIVESPENILVGSLKDLELGYELEGMTIVICSEPPTTR
jgi:hypothetical protein